MNQLIRIKSLEIIIINVLHFIKKQDNDREIQSNIYCNYRHSQLREEVRRKTLAILKFREKYADIAQRVCGI